LSSAPTPVPSLARRWARRALDLLVISFLITVGLSVGRQLIDWWRTDPNAGPDLSGLTTTDLDWSRTPVTLKFGNAPTSLERIPFQGDRKQIEDELTRVGQSLVTNSEILPSEVSEAEERWLKTLQSAAPVFWDSTRGNVYRRHEPLPSFVATRFVETDPAATDESPVIQRIVGWGLAFPTTPGDWTIYVFHPDSAVNHQPVAVRPLELPDGARNITDLQGADGSQWQVIQGRGDLAGWVQHFDNQFGTATRLSRIDGAQTTSVKYRQDRVLTEIQIRRDPDGRMTGVIWSAKEGERR
jgi:hypothetical protein